MNSPPISSGTVLMKETVGTLSHSVARRSESATLSMNLAILLLVS